MRLLYLVLVFTLLPLCKPLSIPLFSKLGLWSSRRRDRVQNAPKVTLVVEIPMSTVHYDKPLDVKAGGRFLLETPMEKYAYSSAGRSNLHRVNIAYLMQSMYRPNHMCFFLHFWSMKDPSVPWDIPHKRIPPPYWSRYSGGSERQSRSPDELQYA